MNTQILVKCLEELKKETPNIEYIKGMLETLIMLSGATIPTYVTTSTSQIKELVRSDETVEEIPAHLRAGPIASGSN
jgi:hypothetical protein